MPTLNPGAGSPDTTGRSAPVVDARCRSRVEDRGSVRLGLVGVVALTMIISVALSAGTLKRLLSEETHRARFTEAGGLRAGDEVRVSGLRLGQVTDIDIVGREVEVTFSIDKSVHLGAQTAAAVKSGTVLGRKYLQIEPSGEGTLDAAIPASRTSSPFDVQEQLETLTGEVGRLDIPTVEASLNTLADTIAETPPHLRAALRGLRRASHTIASRDVALRQLFASAAGATEILAQRSADLTSVISNGNALLDELYRRREEISLVLVSVTGLVGQLRGLVRDNDATIGPALDQLAGVSDLLKTNRKNLTAAIEGLRNYSGSLGEAVNGGPWFYGYISNLVPSGLAQQTSRSLFDLIGDPSSGAKAGGAG